MSVVTQRRARVAALQKHRLPTDPDLAAAKSALAEANLEAAIERSGAALTDQQRVRLAALITGALGGAK